MDIFEKSKVNVETFGMFMLDRFPVFQYTDVKENINVGIFGESQVRLDFFKMVVSACHMLGRTLNVTVVDATASEFITSFMNENPMVRDTFYIREIKKDGGISILSDREGKYSYAVKENGPLVNINIITESIQSRKDLEQLDYIVYSQKEDSLFKYSWIIGSDSENNKEMAAILENYFDKADYYKNKHHSFVGELNNGNGQMVSQIGKKQRISHIVLNMDTSVEEMKKFQNNLKEMAFNIHRFYAKEYNSRQSIKDMKKDFRKPYQMVSSMRSAISVPYKVASVISSLPETITETVIEEFCEKVFENNLGNCKERLVYLEHKSWMIWLICNGWRLPVLDEIKKYAFIGGNDFKNKKNKFHPCLIECFEEAPMELEELTEIQWDDRKRLQKTKDPLDKVSIRLYLYARERSTEICCSGGELERQIEKISKYLLEKVDDQMTREERVSSVTNLRNTFEKMAEFEKNAVNQFHYCVKEFEEDYKEELKNDKRLSSAFFDLVDMAGIVKEASYHRSYKKSDLTIIKAIPYLLKTNKVNCLYKLVSDDKSWENLLSSILIEPNKIVILYDDWSVEKVIREHKKYADILDKMGLGHISCTVVGIRSASGLLNKLDSQDIVDITGAEADFVFKVKSMPEFEEIPFIVVKGMDIQNLSTCKSEKYLYPVQKSLSVAETLQLSDAYFFTESDANGMAVFSSIYDKLWKLYREAVEPIDWKRFFVFVHEADEQNKKCIELGKGIAPRKEKIKILQNRQMIELYHITRVLEEMKADGYITKYILPEDANGYLEVVSLYENVGDEIKWMIEKSQKGSNHYFKYIKKQEHENFKTIIYDDTCVLHHSKIEQFKNKHKYEDVVTSLNKIISHEHGNNLVFESTFDEKDGITLFLKNRSVKRLMEREGNMLEQYVYFTMLENKFDDIKWGVNLAWTTEDDFQDSIQDTTNEIDMVATCGMNSYFVSCKQKIVENEHLTEIKYFADHFGVHGKAILVTSHKAKPKIIKRADKMKVYVMDEEIIDNGKLSEAFAMILSGAGVEEINHWSFYRN